MRKMIALFVTCMVLLSACGSVQTPSSPTSEPLPVVTTQPVETSTPPETTSPPETTLPAAEPSEPSAGENGTQLSQRQLQMYDQLFAWRLDPYSVQPSNQYNVALGIRFAAPEEIDLELFFNNGFVDERRLSEEDRAWLTGNGYPASQDYYRISSERMEEALNQFFGLSLAETKGIGLDQFAYNAEGDCYYLDPSGLFCVDSVSFTDGYFYDGGLIRLYYTNTLGQAYVFTMQSRSYENSGYGYRFISNLPVE